jgi:hypothetical protein
MWKQKWYKLNEKKTMINNNMIYLFVLKIRILWWPPNQRFFSTPHYAPNGQCLLILDYFPMHNLYKNNKCGLQATLGELNTYFSNPFSFCFCKKIMTTSKYQMCFHVLKFIF